VADAEVVDPLTAGRAGTALRDAEPRVPYSGMMQVANRLLSTRAIRKLGD
jgi:hypothetical protein